MQTDWLTLACAALSRGALRRITFSRPLPGFPDKVTGRLCKNGEKTILSLEETLPGGKVRHRNLPPEAWGEALESLGQGYLQINLSTAAGDAQYKRNKKGSSVLTGGEALVKKLECGDWSQTLTETLQREKQYLLRGDEPFLQALGISDRTGRVHDKKQAKFRQINRFLEHITDIAGDLPEDFVRIYDLCCGKSYLSFAVYHYFTVLRKTSVQMLCMDLKADVMEECAAIADALGFTGMTFRTGDVRNAPRDPAPDLLLSLHACDVATDIVLHLGADLGAKVILSTPCCQHDLAGKLDCPQLDFAARYPHLRRQLCATLTDALRLARLRARGYEVKALELTDPEDTPKNTLLRARRTAHASADCAAAEEEYRAMLRFLLGHDAMDYPEELGV